MIEIHIGIDDTDSPKGMCTTYLCAILVEKLLSLSMVRFKDYPYLVRLNPNIPFKTRGNGAVSLHILCPEEGVDRVLGIVSWAVRDYAETHGKTQPAFIILQGAPPPILKELYQRAVRELVPCTYAKRLLEAVKGKVLDLGYRGAGRGLVGALSSIGAYPLEEFTYELLLYRGLKDKRRSREVALEKFFELDRKFRPVLFATVDYVSRRVLATPHGPDPVIAGLRSLDPSLLSRLLPTLVEAFNAERALIFKTNQVTGAHLRIVKRIRDVRPYDSVVLRGEVVRGPEVMRGGHVRFDVRDDSGSIACMVYRPTGKLNKVARLLARGDLIEVGGGALPYSKHGLTLNVEYIRVLKAEPERKALNPLCPMCGHRAKSAGRGKGFKCPKCGYKFKGKKVIIERARVLEPGLYIPSPIAYRHLTLPKEILGLAGVHVRMPLAPWHYP